MQKFAAVKKELIPNSAARRVFGLIGSEMGLIEAEFERQVSSNIQVINYLGDYLRASGGKRIMPAGWATESTAPRGPVVKGGPPIYGYQWWTLPAPGRPAQFAAWGYGGQYLMVVPSLDLIVVFTGWNIYDKPELEPGFALGRVLDAVKQ